MFLSLESLLPNIYSTSAGQIASGWGEATDVTPESP